ncbi:SIR2 family protein [Methanoculleus sp.]|uniref:SIR2 family protein n=1 Tax=Methanoculleus sp. TaxID=90427 RepID=UPI0025FF783C|nr:SIR2 family protein [Methanoculleus sp.]
MIPDDIIPAAFAVASSPKRYALLLGSGISGGKLPTGREITRDLIRRTAALSMERIDGDPLDWYRERYGAEPTFPGLFKTLKARDGDEEAILDGYFTVEDEDGERVAPGPTPAHRTIAAMVKEGLIGLIVTTNFDDLMERALREEGVQPVVITELSDPEMMSVFPDRCRIVKVNGDYPSTDLRMTPEDLKDYTPNIKDYLHRIFAEYGLIVCGWSAKDDTGLVRILAGEELEGRVRRYSTLWCRRKGSAPIPAEVVRALHPWEIAITTADEFFAELRSRIEVLRRYDHREPLSVATAVQKVKRILREQRPELVLADLIHEETDRVLESVAARERYQAAGTDPGACYQAMVRELEDTTAPLAAMAATVAYYDDTFTDLITDMLVRLINIPPVAPETAEGLLRLRYYPALLAIYAAGIAAVRARHFNMLEAIVRRPKRYRYGGPLQETVSIYDLANIPTILGRDPDWLTDLARERFGSDASYRDYPYLALYAMLQGLFPNRYAFYESLDIFEYVFGLAYLAEFDGDEIQPEAFRSSMPRPLQARHWYRRYDGLPLNPAAVLPPLPLHIVAYLADVRRRAAGSDFFGGDLSEFERANRSYAKAFGIECPETGIELPEPGG